MIKVTAGDPVPDFAFECTNPHVQSFSDLIGQNVVLYFYPRDNTPGCTQEGKDFRSLYPQFASAHTKLLGISRDSLPSHKKFCDKLDLPFPLISDKDEKLCQYFGVVIEKNMFARLVFGIERSTFLIDKKGIIRKVWRNVKVSNHAQEVLDSVREL